MGLSPLFSLLFLLCLVHGGFGYFSTCPRFTNVCIVVSTFDNSTNGVTVQPPNQLFAGEFNGGFKVISQGNGTFFFVLPLPYRGNKLSVLNGYLYFDLAEVLGLGSFTVGTNATNGGVFTPSNYTDDVVIVGSDREIYYTISTPTSTYTHYSIHLNASEGWYVAPKGSSEKGRPATDQDMIAVLSYVECFFIRGKYFFSSSNTSISTTYLDNIKLCEGPPPYTRCPNDCAGNGVCVQGVCNCSYGYTGPDCGTKSPCATNRFPISYISNWKK